MNIYMIRNRITGQYSKGGLPPLFVSWKEAKVWRSMGDVKKHLKLIWRNLGKLPGLLGAYDNCDIISYTVNMPGHDPMPVYEMFAFIEEEFKGNAVPIEVDDDKDEAA